jgi:hypothetical protein
LHPFADCPGLLIQTLRAVKRLIGTAIIQKRSFKPDFAVPLCRIEPQSAESVVFFAAPM